MHSSDLRSDKLPAEAIENWDDGDLEGIDDIQLRTASTTTSIASSSAIHHRDSVSSRISSRSEFESNPGEDDWQVLVDEGKTTTQDAIASAKAKGIPIPENVPRSALIGGTIRRLGGKKIKKAMTDDWSEDLDFPGTGELKIAKTEEGDVTESLRQISAAFRNTLPQAQTTPNPAQTAKQQDKLPSVNLDSWKDKDDDDENFGDVPTIKVQKTRPQVQPLKLNLSSPSKTPVTSSKGENLEEDLELPNDGKLVLSKRREQPRTPHQEDDFDLEWAEGSLGTRHGGTRREGRSGRSSSISAMSPSVSSCLTGESEDEGLDGLVLPVDESLGGRLEQAMKARKDTASPENTKQSTEKQGTRGGHEKEEDWSGVDFGDGDVFDANKLTLNRNVKHKVERSKSPSRRTQTTVTFTSKTTSQTTPATSTRIPRLHHSHDRPRSTLEPVSETGQPLPKYRRPESKLGHSAQSSVSSLPTPTTPSTPSTPSRRGLNTVQSRDTLRHDAPTTTSAQLLRAKRSMPVMRVQSPSKSSAYQRPPSRNEGPTGRLHIPVRSKTPTSERPESRLEALRRPPVPFLPGGSSQAQSHHINVKNQRSFRRTDSDGSLDGGVPIQRPTSRLNTIRPETPARRRDIAPAELALNAKRPITKPTKRRNFGDGTELEIFDDLPTSATMESRFVKQPIGKGAPRLRNKLGQSLQNPSVTSIATTRTDITRSDRTETPMPSTPLSPTKQEYVPRFARDTAASRNAREQRQASMHMHSRDNLRDASTGPLAPLSTNWRSRLAGFTNISQTLRKKTREPQKPQLIKPLGNGVNEEKTIKGMHYNPVLLRWEGNENDLTAFDIPAPTLLTPTSPKPAPALITNVGSLATGVQISGGMIFDPHRMCWLKMAPTQRDASTPSLRGGVGSVQLEEEEDVFAGLEDLKEEEENSRQASLRKVSAEVGSGVAPNEEFTGGGDSSDEGFMAVSEEFDVGPEFIRRQRAEEEKWRRKTDKWMRSHEEAEALNATGQVEWRWAIRGLAIAG